MSNPLSLVKEEPQTPEKNTWYSKGLRFKCTECGRCCTGGPGYVWVTQEEIESIALHLGLSIEAFSKKYLRYVKGRYSLIEDRKTYDCVFLKDKKCQIYTHRPKQCRTYPWWPENLKSESDWEEAASWCEGINNEAPIVPIATIERELSIQTGAPMPEKSTFS